MYEQVCWQVYSHLAVRVVLAGTVMMTTSLREAERQSANLINLAFCSATNGYTYSYNTQSLRWHLNTLAVCFVPPDGLTD